MRGALATLALLWAVPAPAHSLWTDVTVGKGYLGASLLGDLELRPEQTFVTLGYSGIRPGQDVALSHQLSAGVDQAVGERWMVSGLLVGSPRSVNVVPLGPDSTFRASNGSFGASASAAYDSRGFGFFEYGADGSVGVTSYTLTRRFDSPLRPGLEQKTSLNVVRPGAGFTALFDLRTELSLRGSVSLYSSDPLTAGRFTEEQLQRLQSRFRPGPGQAELLLQSLLAADAVSGLQSAPVRYELRAALSHRFSRSWKAQLAYSYIRYVPTQGAAHVPSVRLWWTIGERWRVWSAVALQRDVPEDLDPSSSVLLTVGLELRFGGAGG